LTARPSASPYVQVGLPVGGRVTVIVFAGSNGTMQISCPQSGAGGTMNLWMVVVSGAVEPQRSVDVVCCPNASYV
jgi:hypothetical protein